MFCRPWTQRTEVVTAAGLHCRVTGCSNSEMSMSSCCVGAVRRRLTTHAREGHSRCRCRANDVASAGVVVTTRRGRWKFLEESEVATASAVA